MKPVEIHPLRRIRRPARPAIALVSLVALVALVATFALIAPPALRAENHDDAPQMDEETMAMMQAWTAAGTPGPMHEHIGRSEGEWVTTTKMWMDPTNPDAEPMVSQGTMTGEWLYDGRYLETRHTGDMMGQPFRGTGLEAYDNVRETFVSTWFDNMSTGIMTLEGRCLDDACDKMEYEGEYADPLSGEMMTHRMVFTWHADDQFTLEGFTETPEGEVKGMEMTAKKK